MDETRSDFYTSELNKLKTCHRFLKEMVYRDTEECKKSLSGLLDDLNDIEYSLKLADEQMTGAILIQCCYLVPLKHDVLVTKVCHLAANLLSKQQLVMSHGVEIITEYLIEALQRCAGWTYCDILRALGVVLYENGGKLAKFHVSLLGPNGYLLQLAQAAEADIVRGAMQCIENICIRIPSQTYLEEKYHKACFQVLMDSLKAPKPANMDSIIHARIVISGLRGIHCILLGSKALDAENHGPLLAALKVYILFGLPGISTTVLPSLFPTPLSKYDPNSKVALPGAKQGDQKSAAAKAEGGSADSTTQENRPQSKKPRKRRGKGKKATDKDEDETDIKTIQDGVGGMSVSHDMSQDASASGSSTSDPYSLLLPWSRLSSSESDFSDTEGGQSSKLRSVHCKLRQCAVGCLHAVVKTVERRVMFGYWTAFIPDTPNSGGPGLFTSVMKDPSPKVRTGSLAVLTALVDNSKQFLMAAEEADQYRNAPFTPFSVNLGHMVKEIHRCLLLSLVSETSPLAITQIIKCLATIIPNVPYHRLKPGLLSRIIKQIRPFISHRDPNIRVACLTCMGSMAGVQAPMMEVHHILNAPHPPTKFSDATGLPQRFVDPLHPKFDSDSPRQNSESGYHSGEGSRAPSQPGSSPGIPTPNLPSGSQTPSLSDQTLYATGGDTSWLIKLCIRNVAAHLLDTPEDTSTRVPRPAEGQGHVQPLPVRLESLQVLSILSKNYFALIRPSLFLIRDVVYFCLEDHDPVVQLHGAKLLEETGSVVLQQYQDNVDNKPDISLMTGFWMPLLNGPLPNTLQQAEYHAVKSTICDCLSNIGPHIFDQMPMDKRILCITLMLGLCNDEDHHVRAAAVRVLGVYVLYPSLREDVTFVADVANCVIKCLGEHNLGVRVKASWSLGNLSDALVINKNTKDDNFLEDFSDMLLLKLFDVAVRSSQDNDKVKSNAVRALGNLLRYLPQKSLRGSRFNAVIESSVQALIKNITTGTMKVRWNACYATSNMFKNDELPLEDKMLSVQIHSALSSVVKDCKNFKVRINAALAFSIPQRRCRYGNEGQYAAIWDNLVTALQSAESVTDFTEYRYRDSLTEQVCGTLVHLSTLLEGRDLDELARILDKKHDILLEYMDKYKQLITSNKGSDDKIEAVREAQKHLQSLSGSVAEKPGSFLHFLSDLYEMQTPEPVFDDSQMTNPPQPPKSGFKQTYD